jgi:hypothetical protein
MCTDANLPSGSDIFRRFLTCCHEHPETKKLVARLARCDPRIIFVCLRSYLENRPDLNRLTKEREKAHRSIIRQGLREHGVAAAVGTWLHARADQAFDTKRKGVAHCTESLVWLQSYLEAKSGKRPSAGDLALLIEAAQEALGRRHFDVSPESLRRELSQFKRRNPLYMECLKAEFPKAPAGVLSGAGGGVEKREKTPPRHWSRGQVPPGRPTEGGAGGIRGTARLLPSWLAFSQDQ